MRMEACLGWNRILSWTLQAGEEGRTISSMSSSRRGFFRAPWLCPPGLSSSPSLALPCTAQIVYHPCWNPTCPARVP